MLHTRLFAVALFSVSLFTASAFAQDRGGIKGVLTDNSGAVIPAAVISLEGPGGQLTGQTQADGSYSFLGLPQGEYSLQASYPGFSVARKTVAVGSGVLNVPIELELSVGKEQVLVQSESGPNVSLESDQNATALVLKGDDLQALPDDPDDLQDALQALAGPGAGPNGGSIYIDGFSGGSLPAKETIREIRINQNPFSAEFDRLGFGRIEILTKPGTDSLRGSLFLNDSDGVFNSRNPLSTNKPDYSNRMFGGNVGGPLGKKASFLLDFNRRSIDDNAVVYAPNYIDPVTLATVPILTSVLAPNTMTRIVPRIDYQLTPGNTLVARFEWERMRRENSGVGGLRLPAPYSALGYNETGGEQNFTLTETAVLNSRMINETRFQFEREVSNALGSAGQPQINVSGAFTTGGNQVGNASSTQHHYELQNSTSLALGAHTIRWGVRLRRTDTSDYAPTGFGGTFSFLGGSGPVLDANNQPVAGPDGQPVMTRLLGVDQYYRTLLFQQLGYSAGQIRALGGGASRFTISGGNPFASVAQFDAGPWIQDDWRARPNLTLSLGLRYEAQTNISDYRSLAPRIGFAWAPGQSGNKRPSTVIRGGFGIFYDRVSQNLTLNTRLLNGSNQVSYLVNNPDFFPNVPSLSTLTPSQNSVYSIDPKYRSPYSMQSAIGIERQLPRSSTVALTYTYTRANHVAQTVPINAPVPGTYPAGSPELGVRPFGDEGNLFEYQSGGLMKQHMLMANFNTRLSRAISLSGNYALNYAKDLSGSPSNPYNFLMDWGRAAFDRRHRFMLVGSASAPFGLRVNPFVIAQSGSPYDVLLGTDLYGDTLLNARPAFAAPGDPGAICKGAYGCFAVPAPGSNVNLVPRNQLTMPGLISINLRLSRTFGFGPPRGGSGGSGGNRDFGGGGRGGPGGPGGPGGMRMGGAGGMFGGEGSSEHRFSLTFGVMATNILNHFNPGGYQGNINSPLFGQPTAVNTGFGGGGRGGGPGGPGGNAANNRRIEFQTRFSF